MMAALALLFFTAACSGGSDSEGTAPTTTEPVEEDGTSTTEESDDDDDDSANQTVSAEFVEPLTGLPTDDSEVRPALAVKIDNHRSARPQVGLDQADIVFEARAEGVTRFMAVFHSQTPDPVGPVRSSRTSDFDLLRGLNTPLYASSGGNDYVARSLRSLPIYDVTAISQRQYQRDSSRSAPHNLFVDTSTLFGLAPEDAQAPFPWFEYRADGEAVVASGTEVDGPVSIVFREGPLVTYSWDSSRSAWLRSQDDQPHATVAGEQLGSPNVVVMVTNYVTSPADSSSPELVSVGEGPLFVLTDGMVVEGTWTRSEADEAPSLVDEDGETIALTPGATWVLYPGAGQVELPE